MAQDKFSVDMGGPIQAAVPGTQALQQAGDLYEQAGATQGKALGDLTTFMGSTALSAYQGKLLADETRDINKIIEDEKVRVSQLPNSAEEADRAIQSGSGLPGQFKRTTDQLYDAMVQGKLSSNAFKIRLDSTVREYSAKMPGWASDFRRNAAETMGMSGLDTSGADKQAAYDLRAKASWEFSLKQDQDIMTKYGLTDPREITPAHRTVWEQGVQAETNLKQMQNDRALSKFGEEDRNNIASGVMGAHQYKTLTDVTSQWQQFSVANQGKDLHSKELSDQFGLQIVNNLNLAELSGNQLIAQMLDPRNGPPITVEHADKLRQALKSSYDQQRANLKTAEGASIYSQILKNTDGEAKRTQDQLTIATPVLAKYPVLLPDMVRAYAVGMPEAQFLKQFPVGGREFLSLTKTVPPGVLGDATTAATKQENPVPVAQVEAVLGKEAANQVVQSCLQVAGDMGRGSNLTPEQLEATVGYWGCLGRSVNLIDDRVGPSQRKEIERATRNLSLLSKDQASRAARPMYENATRAQIKQANRMERRAFNMGLPKGVEFDNGGMASVNLTSLGYDSEGQQIPQGVVELQRQVAEYNSILRIRQLTGRYIQGTPSLEGMGQEGVRAMQIQAGDRANKAREDTKSAVEQAEVVTQAMTESDPEGRVLPGTPAVALAKQAQSEAETQELATLRQKGGQPGTPATVDQSVGDPRFNSKLIDASETDPEKLYGTISKVLDTFTEMESNNNPKAKNPTKGSTATGLFQVTGPTWDTYKAAGAKMLGIKVEDMDPLNGAHSKVVAFANIREGLKNLGTSFNIKQLRPVDIYSLQMFGATGGPKVVQANDSVFLRTLVSKKAIKDNRYAEDLTVGQWRIGIAKKLQ